MKRIIAAALTLILVVSCMPFSAFAAENHTCANYAQCTQDGAEIYTITKENCPIRLAPNNKGKIVARGKIGELLSVNRVFWTIKMTRWVELNVHGSDQKLYVHIDNVKPHEAHAFVNVFTTDKGSLDFCAICGIAQAVAEKETAVCDLTCIGDQALKGSFSTYDASFISVVAQIIVGEIPGVGTLADARDIVGDVVNGEEAWVIAADCIGLLPLVGMMKYTDELATVAKNADDAALLLKNADEAVEAGKRVKYIHWGKWGDYPHVEVNGKTYAEIGDFKYTHHAVDEFLNPSIETNQILQISPVSGKPSWVEHSRGVPPSYVNWILTEGVENGTTVITEEFKDGVKRLVHQNGSLIVILEDDIVVSIMTRNK